jgi:hypothetical protein
MERRAAVIQQLLDTFHATLPYFDQPEEALNRSYAPGKWTLREILVHLSDTETVYLDRLRRLAAEPNPTLMNMDENLWAKNLFYASRDLGLVKLQYEAARRSIIEMARKLDESVDGNTGTHSTAGTKVFGKMIAGFPDHNAHHLEQMKAIAAGKTWTPKA